MGASRQLRAHKRDQQMMRKSHTRSNSRSRSRKAQIQSSRREKARLVPARQRRRCDSPSPEQYASEQASSTHRRPASRNLAVAIISSMFTRRKPSSPMVTDDSRVRTSRGGKAAEDSKCGAPQARFRKVASPQPKVRRVDKLVDEDWSRELRAWSPERRQEQSKRRDEAEVLMKAKEEEEEEHEQSQSSDGPLEAHRVQKRRKSKKVPANKILKSKKVPASKTLKTLQAEVKEGASPHLPDSTGSFAASADAAVDHNNTTNAGSESANSPSSVCKHSIGVAILPEEASSGIKDEDFTRPEEASSGIKDEDFTSQPVQVESRNGDFVAGDVEDMCLSEVEEFLDEDMCLSEVEEFLDEVRHATPGPHATSDSSRHAEPDNELASLMQDLATNAARFEPMDYWVNGAWDLQGLREDAEQQRKERWSHEETLWRSSPHTISRSPACSPGKQTADESLQRSPSPDYPVCSSLQPRRLVFSLAPKPVPMRIGGFAKRTQAMWQGPDPKLARNLRRLLA